MSGTTGAGQAGGRRARTPGRSSRPANTVRQTLLNSLSPALAEVGFDVEDVSVTRAGSRSVVRVVVDRDGGVDLDAVADASRVVSAVLDAGDGPVPGAYVLEVTSPGVDRPLTLPRHWRRAVGRLVSVRTTDGRRLLARLTDADETSAELVPRPAAAGAAPPGQRLAYADVVRAVVEVEFSRTDDEFVLGSEVDDETGDVGTGDVEGTGQ